MEFFPSWQNYSPICFCFCTHHNIKSFFFLIFLCFWYPWTAAAPIPLPLFLACLSHFSFSLFCPKPTTRFLHKARSFHSILHSTLPFSNTLTWVFLKTPHKSVLFPKHHPFSVLAHNRYQWLTTQTVPPPTFFSVRRTAAPASMMIWNVVMPQMGPTPESRISSGTTMRVVVVVDRSCWRVLWRRVRKLWGLWWRERGSICRGMITWWGWGVGSWTWVLGGRLLIGFVRYWGLLISGVWSIFNQWAWKENNHLMRIFCFLVCLWIYVDSCLGGSGVFNGILVI